MKKTISKSLSWLMALLVLLGGAVGFGPMAVQTGIVVNAEEDFIFIDGADSMTGAPVLSMDTMYASSLAGREVKYYQFTTPAQKGYIDYYSMNINISTHSWSDSAAVQFVIMNRLEEVQATNIGFWGGERSSNISLKPSYTYYIKVYNNWVNNEERGNFKLKLSFFPDEVGNDMASAKEIENNKRLNSTLDGEFDVDVYKFTTPEDGNCTLKLTNIDTPTHSWAHDSQFYGQVRNSINEILLDLRATPGKTSEGAVELQPNTVYYLFVGNPDRGRGNYAFEVDFPQAIDLTLSHSSLAMNAGESTGIKAYVQPAGASEVEWTSSDSDVATVDNGIIKAVGAGTAVITATISNGKSASCEVTVKVPALKNKSTVSATEVTLGNAVKVNLNANGGTAPYKYSVLYKKSTGTSWTTLAANTVKASVDFAPKAAVVYNLKVIAKDSKGKSVTKKFNINVTKPLTNTSSLGAVKVKVGQKVKVRCYAKGGAGGYTYSVYYKKSSKTVYKKLRDWNAANVVMFTPSTAVNYDFKVKAKDSTGRIVSKVLTLKVTK